MKGVQCYFFLSRRVWVVSEPENRLETVLIATGLPAIAAPTRTPSNRVNGSHIHVLRCEPHGLPVCDGLQLLFVPLPELRGQLDEFCRSTLLIGTALSFEGLVHGLDPLFVRHHGYLGTLKARPASETSAVSQTKCARTVPICSRIPSPTIFVPDRTRSSVASRTGPRPVRSR